MPFAEARRILTLCQVCKYCNGYCDVFRAIESRRGFSAGDLGFLANLCHNCGNCWNACQYAPPNCATIPMRTIPAQPCPVG